MLQGRTNSFWNKWWSINLLQEIQVAVLELMTFTVKEVKRLNPYLGTDQLTVENTISKSFHKILQQELNPIWHQVWSNEHVVLFGFTYSSSYLDKPYNDKNFLKIYVVRW